MLSVDYRVTCLQRAREVLHLYSPLAQRVLQLWNLLAQRVCCISICSIRNQQKNRMNLVQWGTDDAQPRDEISAHGLEYDTERML